MAFLWRGNKEGGVGLVNELENQEPIEPGNTGPDDSPAPEVAMTEATPDTVVEVTAEPTAEAPVSEAASEEAEPEPAEVAAETPAGGEADLESTDGEPEAAEAAPVGAEAEDVAEASGDAASDSADAAETDPEAEEGASEPPGPAGIPGIDWYIIHTYSGFENKVKESLRTRADAFGYADRIGEILIPTEDVVEMRNGKKVTSCRLLYPGYVLLQLKMDDELWHVVKNTPRVTGFVGGDPSPTPLTADEVNQILYRQTSSKEKPRPKMSFEHNDRVKIIDGPFTNFTGTVEEVNPDRSTLKVMVTIFGRGTPVELEYFQVEKEKI